MNIHDLNQTKLSAMKTTASLLNLYGVGTVSMSHDKIFVNGEAIIMIEDDLVLNRTDLLYLNVKQRLVISDSVNVIQNIQSDIMKVREADSDNAEYKENIEQWFKELEE